MTKPRSRKNSTASAPPDFAKNNETVSHEEDELEWIRAAVNASPVSYEKPTVSYASLIGRAISKAPGQRARLSTIYHYIATRYPYYQLDQGGWQNSIRHNLTVNKCFIKDMQNEERPGKVGKGSYWKIAPEFIHCFQNGVFEKPRGSVVVTTRRRANSSTSATSDAARRSRSSLPSQSDFGSCDSSFLSSSLQRLPPLQNQERRGAFQTCDPSISGAYSPKFYGGFGYDENKSQEVFLNAFSTDMHPTTIDPVSLHTPFQPSSAPTQWQYNPADQLAFLSATHEEPCDLSATQNFLPTMPNPQVDIFTSIQPHQVQQSFMHQYDPFLQDIQPPAEELPILFPGDDVTLAPIQLPPIVHNTSGANFSGNQQSNSSLDELRMGVENLLTKSMLFQSICPEFHDLFTQQQKKDEDNGSVFPMSL